MRLVPSGAVAAVAIATVFFTPTPGGAAAAQEQAASVAQARPGLAPIGAKGTYLDQQGRVLSMNAVQADARTSSALAGCTPGNGADNPHYTHPDVSGHGTYVKGTCTKNTARVYNCLYEFYADNTWREKACSSTVTVTAGGGSGNRSNARRSCDSTAKTSWRNHEDVDVIEEVDNATKPFRQADVACRVN